MHEDAYDSTTGQNITPTATNHFPGAFSPGPTPTHMPQTADLMPMEVPQFRSPTQFPSHFLPPSTSLQFLIFLAGWADTTSAFGACSDYHTGQTALQPTPLGPAASRPNMLHSSSQDGQGDTLNGFLLDHGPVHTTALSSPPHTSDSCLLGPGPTALHPAQRHCIRVKKHELFKHITNKYRKRRQRRALLLSLDKSPTPTACPTPCIPSHITSPITHPVRKKMQSGARITVPSPPPPVMQIPCLDRKRKGTAPQPPPKKRYKSTQPLGLENSHLWLPQLGIVSTELGLNPYGTNIGQLSPGSSFPFSEQFATVDRNQSPSLP